MNRDIRRFYDIIAPFYSVINLFLRNGTKKLEKLIVDTKGNCILDIGLGSSRTFLKKNFGSVEGVDISHRMLKKKKQYYVKTYLLDVLEMNAPRRYDLILAHYVVTVIPVDQLMAKINSLIKPNGYVYIVNHFSQENLIGKMEQWLSRFTNIFHFQLFFKSSMLPLNGFELIQKQKIGWLNNYEILVLRKL